MYRVKVYNQSWSYLGLEQKQNYQKNMLWAYLIVACSAFLLVSIIFILTNNKIIVQPGASGIPNINKISGNGIPPTKKSISTNSKGSMAMLLPNGFPGGYMSNYRIICDSPPLTMFVSTQNNVYEPNFENISFSEEFIYSEYDENNIFANGTGNSYGDDYGLPTEKPYMPDIQPLPQRPIPNIYIKQKGICEIGSIKWPRFAPKTDTAYVEVTVYVYKNNTISYDFKSIKPEGKGFKWAVEHTLLYKSRFMAPINEYGKAVRDTLEIKFEISLNSKTFIKSSNDQTMVRLLSH